ncbi:MAG: hypothetical protein HW415_1823 [Deltaproteobacteria bacterium]|nr:hypothetical protein [Deltaproteobacteria bacterium]
MNDTSPEMDKRFQEMIMAKSGQERLLMGFSMFETARRQVIATIKGGNADIKKELFVRFYGADFSQEEMEKILQAMG